MAPCLYPTLSPNDSKAGSFNTLVVGSAFENLPNWCELVISDECIGKPCRFTMPWTAGRNTETPSRCLKLPQGDNSKRIQQP